MLRAVHTASLLLASALSAHAADLTLKRAMLSSGGVGYFEYAADVDGDTVLGLDVPLGQVDDILKSLVVFDSGGSVADVELPGLDNTNAAFGDVPFGPDALQSAAVYLNALRGTEVTVAGAHPMTGRVMQAETVTETVKDVAVPRTRVTLLSAEGLRQFVLEDAESVQIVDPVLRERVARALEAVQREASQASRHLTIRLKGTAKRSVAVGYVVGAPLWKPTYRLVLPDHDGAKARLQGWATLENQSGTDWKDVALTLQYGNPVTFRQALYRSYFVQRPEVPVEILGQVLPDIDTRARSFAQAAPAGGMPAAKTMNAARPMPPGLPGSVAEASAPPPPMAGVDTAAALESAEETIFTVRHPVDLAAGHSANIPILDQEVPADRIDLAPFQQRNPLSAVRVKNDGSASLPAGVLTLYDTAGGNSFAGDARLGGLPVGETRLLSFARDLRSTVETTLSGRPDLLTVLTVAEGLLNYQIRRRQAIHFAVTAPVKEKRAFLLEVPRSGADQTLIVEDPKLAVTETTATAWRIALSPAAGETREFTVLRDQPVRTSIALISGDMPELLALTGAEKLSAAGQAGLRRILDLRRDVTRAEQDVEANARAQHDVETDEDRIRKNLDVVSASDTLHGRMLRALDADETKLDQLGKAAADLRARVDQTRKDLATAVATFKI